MFKTAAKNDMKIRVIGDIQPLDNDIRTGISELESATVNNGGLNFTIALNYGSRMNLQERRARWTGTGADGN